ncbi:hypothetical protein BDY21DRAFT_149029 [Lineolata rhizophorae]|uniref:Uncharacterized protein n=1 Tax=Lineolata rhizophorae TaxID=578093 RepID=A0A6A6NMM2_9PEZI|nr:hypothetical protein BDY21DRAFT_149029 [Lineolata rhizophorae]
MPVGLLARRDDSASTIWATDVYASIRYLFQPDPSFLPSTRPPSTSRKIPILLQWQISPFRRGGQHHPTTRLPTALPRPWFLSPPPPLHRLAVVGHASMWCVCVCAPRLRSPPHPRCPSSPGTTHGLQRPSNHPGRAAAEDSRRGLAAVRSACLPWIAGLYVGCRARLGPRGRARKPD